MSEAVTKAFEYSDTLLRELVECMYRPKNMYSAKGIIEWIKDRPFVNFIYREFRMQRDNKITAADIMLARRVSRNIAGTVVMDMLEISFPQHSPVANLVAKREQGR